MFSKNASAEPKVAAADDPLILERDADAPEARRHLHIATVRRAGRPTHPPGDWPREGGLGTAVAGTVADSSATRGDAATFCRPG